jgi:hypothetical protein
MGLLVSHMVGDANKEKGYTEVALIWNTDMQMLTRLLVLFSKQLVIFLQKGLFVVCL